MTRPERRGDGELGPSAPSRDAPDRPEPTARRLGIATPHALASAIGNYAFTRAIARPRQVVARNPLRDSPSGECDPQQLSSSRYTITDYRQDIELAGRAWIDAQQLALDQFETNVVDAVDDENLFASTPTALLRIVLEKRMKQFVIWVAGDDGIEELLDAAEEIYRDYAERPREVELPAFVSAARARVQHYEATLPERAVRRAENFAQRARDRLGCDPEGDRRFMAELEEAARRTRDAIPASQEIELELYSSWIQGQRDGFARLSGRLRVAYRKDPTSDDPRAYRLQRARIEEAEGAAGINHRINEMFSERKGVDLNELKVRKYISFEGPDGRVVATVVLDANNNVNRTSGTGTLAGRVLADPLALWDSVSAERRLPTVHELGTYFGGE